MNRSILLSSIWLFFFACGNHNSPSEKTTTPEPDNSPSIMTAVWNAHGGIDKWNSFDAMTFTLSRGADSPNEIHNIDLRDRRVHIESDSFALGMDGERVWVSPSRDAVSMDPRFYHNLMFYFFAIPFVLSDPGVNIEDTGTRMLDSTSYRSFRVTFEEGTGDADDDEYILLVDPESNQLQWLLYTVTYFSGEPVENYNALHYTDYKTVNGLLFPGKLTGYEYANDTTGSVRYNSNFTSISLSQETPDDSMFTKPEAGEYAE